MIKKKAEIGGETIIVFAIVFIVLLLGGLFLFRSNIDSWMRNLPGVRGPGEEDRRIDRDLEIAICPEGYEIIGEWKGREDPYTLYLKEGGSLKETNIKWDLGDDKIGIQKGGARNDIRLGERLTNFDREKRVSYGEIILDEDVFVIGSDPYINILKREFHAQDEIFKILLLIDKTQIRGNNQICQNSTRISEENMRKALNMIYWGEENPKIVDLRGETKQRVTLDRLNLSPYILDHPEEKYYLLRHARIVEVYRNSSGQMRTDCFIGVIGPQGIFYQMRLNFLYPPDELGFNNCVLRKVFISNFQDLISMEENPLRIDQITPLFHRTNIVLNYSEILTILASKRVEPRRRYTGITGP